MAQDLSSKKQDFVVSLVALAEKGMSIVAQVQELIANHTDMGYASGTPSTGLVQADLDGKDDLKHLTPTVVDAAVAALANINLNNTQKTALRKTTKSALPPKV